jgi:hypothetical protein
MQSKLQRTKSPPGTTRSVPFPFCTGASPAFQPVCGHVLSCQPPPWSTVYSSTPCKTQQLVSHDHTPQPIGRSNQLPTPPPPPDSRPKIRSGTRHASSQSDGSGNFVVVAAVVGTAAQPCGGARCLPTLKPISVLLLLLYWYVYLNTENNVREKKIKTRKKMGERKRTHARGSGRAWNFKSAGWGRED